MIYVRSWKNIFNVYTIEEAVEAMKKNEFTWEWLEHGVCKTINTILPTSIINSDFTKSFFNQIQNILAGLINETFQIKLCFYETGEELPVNP